MITNREVEVLQKISYGFTADQIAGQLHVTNHTIISHKKNLLIKLDASNAPELVRKGFELGILR